MNKIKQDKTLSQIPVIILTEKSDRDTEKKVLESGAWDFIPKPYDADIIKLRLKNVIARSQVSLLKELNNVMNYDPLTEIYSKNKFFSASKALLKAYPDKQFAFLRLDTDRFKLINSFFGNVTCDNLLRYMARHIRDFAKTTECCTFGRIDADVFGIFTPYQGKEHTIEQIEQAVSRMKALMPNYNIMLVYGVYIVTDRELPISQMCGRAETIISSVIRMAKWLNIPVIAEGVDRAEQVEFLKSVGCDYIQGGKKLLLNEDIDLIYFDIQLISKDDEFPLDIDERRLPVIAITQAHSVLKSMTKLKNRVSDFVMKPYIDELVRLRTNNLLKINISGSANEKYFSRTK
ncbi:diguanylate cyclase domain-containing protein [Ruminococcus bicirculans (ex Wegman et al. 2014)]|uniref:diguanylate cyclase domain-containing protein n=1 Tax=Ruminococcus bicirculans (ex Wegman et al. 2014) TaxID=1160721 RepID=UPI00366FADF9